MVTNIKTYCKIGNVNKLMEVLKFSSTANLGGVENPLLYSFTYYGTKKLVQEYVEQSKNISLSIYQTKRNNV